jgi:hypothetical protein
MLPAILPHIHPDNQIWEKNTFYNKTEELTDAMPST